MVCRFYKKVSPAQEGKGKEDQGLAPRGVGLAPWGVGAGAGQHPLVIYGSGMSPDKKHRQFPAHRFPRSQRLSETLEKAEGCAAPRGSAPPALGRHREAQPWEGGRGLLQEEGTRSKEQ